MNFYEAQDDARKRTGHLKLMFFAAVLGTALAVHGALAYFVESGKGAAGSAQGMINWHWEWFPYTAGGTLAVIGLGAFFKRLTLSGGGGAVAEAMGGRRVLTDTQDFHEKRLLNVVEEMAIASGVRVPEVWILDGEEGINAFAAGLDPGSAVVAVSRGCLHRLNRDELQGVVGHEFSHILNGDMRLNFELITWISGIMVLTLLGRVLIQLGSSGRSNRKEGNPGAVFFLGGLVLLLVGAVGAFFGRLIQSAISRQREFLADASAVQFTRNPSGIANALKKIGGFSEGSRMEAARAPEVAHMMFSEGVGGFFSSLFATHPPLAERIRALEPGWKGELLEEFEEMPGGEAERGDVAARAAFSGASGGGADGVDGGRAFPGVEQLRHVHEVLRALPPALVERARSPGTAGAFILEIIRSVESAGAGVETFSSEERMALMDLAMSTARQYPRQRVGELIRACEQQATGDGEVNVFEMMLLLSVRRHLGVASGLRAPAPVRYTEAESLREALEVLLSAMAVIGSEDEVTQSEGFFLGAVVVGLVGGRLLPVTEIPVARIEWALRECEQATVALRGRFLEACVQIALRDGKRFQLELEFIRAVADALGVPVPAGLLFEPNDGRRR